MLLHPFGLATGNYKSNSQAANNNSTIHQFNHPIKQETPISSIGVLSVQLFSSDCFFFYT